MRSDCCSFSRYQCNESGEVIRVTSFIIVYVDDLLWADNEEDWKRPIEALSQLAIGPISRLSVSESIDFLGMRITENMEAI